MIKDWRWWMRVLALRVPHQLLLQDRLRHGLVVQHLWMRRLLVLLLKRQHWWHCQLSHWLWSLISELRKVVLRILRWVGRSSKARWTLGRKTLKHNWSRLLILLRHHRLIWNWLLKFHGIVYRWILILIQCLFNWSCLIVRVLVHLHLLCSSIVVWRTQPQSSSFPLLLSNENPLLSFFFVASITELSQISYPWWCIRAATPDVGGTEGILVKLLPIGGFGYGVCCSSPLANQFVKLLT